MFVMRGTHSPAHNNSPVISHANRSFLLAAQKGRLHHVTCVLFFFLERTHKVWKQCNGTGLAVLLDSGTALKSRLKLPEQKVRQVKSKANAVSVDTRVCQLVQS